MRTGDYRIGQARRILRPRLKPPPLQAGRFLRYDSHSFRICHSPLKDTQVKTKSIIHNHMGDVRGPKRHTKSRRGCAQCKKRHRKVKWLHRMSRDKEENETSLIRESSAMKNYLAVMAVGRPVFVIALQNLRLHYLSRTVHLDGL